MESEYITIIRERQRIYDSICKQEWPRMLQQINRLLEIGTEPALQVLMEMQKKPEFEIYELFYNELVTLKLAFEIYTQEKALAITNHIFKGIRSVDMLQKRICQNKF